MKKATFLSALLLSSALAVSSCRKTDKPAGTSVLVTVIKDCTGEYLRYEGKDYQICNGRIAASFPNGAPASAVFTKVAECKAPDTGGICMMYHANEGWITVTELETMPD